MKLELVRADDVSGWSKEKGCCEYGNGINGKIDPVKNTNKKWKLKGYYEN